MSCYFRHLKEIFAEAGIEATRENRTQLDEAFHKVVGIDYKDCPAAWRKIKLETAGDARKRRDFIARLRQALD